MKRIFRYLYFWEFYKKETCGIQGSGRGLFHLQTHKTLIVFFHALNPQYSFFAFIEILPDWNVTLKKILFFGSIETLSSDFATYLYFSVVIFGLKE